MGNRHFRPKAEHGERFGRKQSTTVGRWYVLDPRVGTMGTRQETEPWAKQQRTLKVKLRIRGVNQKVVGLLKGSEQGSGISSDILESWRRIFWKRWH